MYLPSDALSRPLNQTLRPSISTGFHPLPPQSHEHQGQIEGSGFVYENAVTPTTSQSRVGFGPSYYPTYENGSLPNHPPPARNHGPRYSMPTSPSGFVPISSAPISSSYTPVSYSPEPSTFSVAQGHQSHSPSPNPPPHAGYSPHHAHPGYSTVLSTPPSLTAPPPPLPPPNVTPHRISHSFSTSQMPDYLSYQLTSPGHEQVVQFPTQSVEYGTSLPPPNPAHSAPPQMYRAHTPTAPSPSSEVLLPATPGPFTTGSRPLPQPGQFQRDRRYSVAVPPSSSFPQHIGTGFPSTGLIPPVPPNYRRIPSAPGHPIPPPLPVPPSQVQGNLPRPSALPQPPLQCQPGQSAYQPPPPPPLPDVPQHTQLPPSISSSFVNTSHFQGLPPRPPQPHPNYGQPLPTPPPLHGDWQ